MSREIPGYDDLSSADTVASEEDTPYESSQRADQVEYLGGQIRKVLKTLSEREAEVIRLRWGLDDNEKHTLEKAGDKIGITREGVRQVEKRAIEKLKRKRRLHKLKEFL